MIDKNLKIMIWNDEILKVEEEIKRCFTNENVWRGVALGAQKAISVYDQLMSGLSTLTDDESEKFVRMLKPIRSIFSSELLKATKESDMFRSQQSVLQRQVKRLKTQIEQELPCVEEIDVDEN